MARGGPWRRDRQDVDVEFLLLLPRTDDPTNFCYFATGHMGSAAFLSNTRRSGPLGPWAWRTVGPGAYDIPSLVGNVPGGTAVCVTNASKPHHTTRNPLRLLPWQAFHSPSLSSLTERATDGPGPASFMPPSTLASTLRPRVSRNYPLQTPKTCPRRLGSAALPAFL